jgi:TolB protein
MRGSFLAGVLLALAVGASDSSATLRGRNGRIAFEHIGRSDGGAIYAMTSQGTKRRLLTPSRRASSWSPSYSPDGRRIAFVSGYKRADVWLMRSDGSHERQLTHTKSIAEADPAWSPDGKQIVFDIDRDPVNSSPQQGIWVVGVNGRGRVRLTNGADGDPSWSPDGTEIAFDRYDDTTQTFNIFVVPAAGGTPIDLSSDPGISDLQPDWSPDGSRILFTTDRPDTFRLDLWTMSAAGGDIRQVTNTQGRDEHDAAWSPDGRWIVYSAGGKGGASSYQLYVIRPDGLNRRVITRACGDCAIINDDPSWQPLR